MNTENGWHEREEVGRGTREMNRGDNRYRAGERTEES